jgi:hypothetical protein
MAPLSNAERQKRYRQRLRERASLDALGSQAREAANRAVETLWGFHQRMAAAGTPYGGLEDYSDLEEFRSSFDDKQNRLSDWCRSYSEDSEDLTEFELAALTVVVEIADALAMEHVKRTKSA